MQDPNEPIWNMTIEDLLVVPPEQMVVAGKGPFVINLLSASTPARVPSSITGFEQLSIYPLSQTENGRPRYRVRLGFFETRAEAETALAQLRDKYPTAFIACPSDEDLRFAPKDLAARLRGSKAVPPAAPEAERPAAPNAESPAAPKAEARDMPTAEPRVASKSEPPVARPVVPDKQPAPASPAKQPGAQEEESDPDAITDIRPQPVFEQTRKPVALPVSVPAPVPVAVQRNVRKGHLSGRHSSHPDRGGTHRLTNTHAPAVPPSSGRKSVSATLVAPARKAHKSVPVAKPSTAKSGMRPTPVKPTAPVKSTATDKSTATVRSATPPKAARPLKRPEPAKAADIPMSSALDTLALVAEAVINGFHDDHAFDDDHGIDDGTKPARAIPAPPPAAAKATPVARNGKDVAKEQGPKASSPVRPHSADATRDEVARAVEAVVIEKPAASTPVLTPVAPPSAKATASEITLELAAVPSEEPIRAATPVTPPPTEKATSVPLTLAVETDARAAAIKISAPALPTPLITAAPVISAAPAISAMPVITAAPVVTATPVITPTPVTNAPRVEEVKIAPPEAAAPPKPVVAVAPRSQHTSGSVSDLDSTQTLRVLTETEINNVEASKWFAVQLGCSEQPANLQMMPRLEIFAEYQLYDVVGTEAGKVMHMLRMGFFSDESAAQVVAGYMKSFFDAPTVARVSVAEHERFSRRQVKAKSTIAPVKNAAPDTSATPQSGNAPAPGRAENNGVSFVAEPRRRWTDAPSAARRAGGGGATALSESAIRRLPANSSLWKRLFK